jgi:hypothetical protein
MNIILTVKNVTLIVGMNDELNSIFTLNALNSFQI